MANYGSIAVKVDPRAFEPALAMLVESALGACWKVSKASWDHDGPTWIVYLPGTAPKNKTEAYQNWGVLGQDVGFPLSVSPDAILFRHGLTPFERWAQGRLEEEMADHYQVGVHYDATGEVRPPGTRRYRRHKTYKEYILTPLQGDPVAIEQMTKRYQARTPEGHW